MMEMKINVEVPGLIDAINTLAAAIANAPVNPTNATGTVTGAPAGGQPAQTPTYHSDPALPQPPVGQMAPAPTQPQPPVAPPPAPVQQAPAVPVAQAPTYTLDQISHAGAALVDAGKMEPLLALLARFGVAAVTQLPPEQYGVFATELRALGAQI